MTTVGIAGLTHLGIVTAAVLASKGFQVIAWDPDLTRSERLASGNPIISEPGLEDLIRKYHTCLKFTERRSDLGQADLVYIASDVPTDDRGESALQGIQTLIDKLPNRTNVFICTDCTDLNDNWISK